MSGDTSRTTAVVLADIARLRRAIVQQEEARRSGHPNAEGPHAKRMMHERRFELLDELARLES